ncbi:hypothetical protein B0H10DRAFT_2443162 [Mycena sp. CBHHK59/15]|nr:hypothetical protein B0H10DRAFT_2443162 [Mycena sp. CBHHK59/15]
MFATFKVYATLALVSVACALDITSISGNPVSEGSLTITWTTSTSDPAGTFSIELTHASFNNQLALANNVDASSLSITVALNNVPAGDGYSIQFVDISNVNAVFASSPDFSIGPVSATQSTTISITPSSTKSASKTTSGSASVSATPISTKAAISPSNTGFGVTMSNTAATSASSAPSSSASTTGTSGALSSRSIPGGSVPCALVALVGAAFALL